MQTMLTIKSNFIDFRDRQGEYYTIDDLTNMSNVLIISDGINFNSKDGIKTGYGFTDGIAELVLNKTTIRSGKVAVINDLSLHMTNKLLDYGFNIQDIYLFYGGNSEKKDFAKWVDSKHNIVYNIMKEYIRANFGEQLNVLPVEDLFTLNKKFNLIIANPPYGKIGANITKAIIDEVEFDEYINLLPANDYKRNDTKDLFNYQYDMISIKAGENFSDAVVTTHLAKIHKNKVNNMTIDEFELSNYIDPALDKYFKANLTRTNYAIDADLGWMTLDIHTNINNIVLLDHRCITHKHFAYSKNTIEYRWNVLKNITCDDIFNEILAVSKNYKEGQSKRVNKFVLDFNTPAEKDNFVKFMYSTDGFRFFAKVFVAANKDSTIPLSGLLPKVDWTRSWTVEEILADYGYTAEEILAVMEDLKNYKGMED